MKKIRHRFILASMLSLFFVLFAIVAGLNFINYRTLVHDADSVSNQIYRTENREEGSSPYDPGAHRPDAAERKDSSGSTEAEAPKEAGSTKPEPQKSAEKNTDKPPEHGPGALDYEEKCFSVTFAAGEETRIRYYNSAEDESSADWIGETASAAKEKGKSRGFVGTYRYRIREDGDSTNVILVDCRKSFGIFRSHLLTSLYVSAAGLFVVALLVIVSSGAIFKTVEENDRRQKQFLTAMSSRHRLRSLRPIPR